MATFFCSFFHLLFLYSFLCLGLLTGDQRLQRVSPFRLYGVFSLQLYRLFPFIYRPAFTLNLYYGFQYDFTGFQPTLLDFT